MGFVLDDERITMVGSVSQNGERFAEKRGKKWRFGCLFRRKNGEERVAAAAARPWVCSRRRFQAVAFAVAAVAAGGGPHGRRGSRRAQGREKEKHAKWEGERTKSDHAFFLFFSLYSFI